MRYIFENLSVTDIEESLKTIIDRMVADKYGETPDEIIVSRVRDEWAAIKRSGLLTDIAAMYEIVLWLKENRHPYMMWGCA